MDELVKKSEDKPCQYGESIDNLYNLLESFDNEWE